MPTAIEQARQLNERAAAHYQAIDNDKSLSDSGKADRKIRYWGEVNREITALKQQDDRTRAAQRTNLQRTLFGLPARATSSDLIAYRDAADRARSIDDQREALTMLRAAHEAGDDMMARAIAARATEIGWADVLNTYVDDIRPEAANGINQLMAQTPSATSNFLEFTEFIAMAPHGPGLTGLSSFALESRYKALVNADDAVPTTQPVW